MSSLKPHSQNPLVNDLYTAIAAAARSPTKTRSTIHNTNETPKKQSFMRRNGPLPRLIANDFEHFEKLLYDLTVMTSLLSDNPSRFRFAYLSLLEELLIVWNRLRNDTFQRPTVLHPNRWATKRQTPPKSGLSSVGSPPLNNDSQSHIFDSQGGSSSPNRWPFGDRLALENLMEQLKSNVPEVPIHIHKLEKKVFLPCVQNYNFIGRILGPRGISARQIEADTCCTILIRGQGSVKDPEKEKCLIGQPGYEHLSEDLHVHVSTEGTDLADCQRRIDRAVSIIESLLTPDYDEYKKAQLLQLAIINGTYRPYKKKHQKNDRNK